MNIEDVGKQIIDSAFNVHRELGPGLLESAYEQCLAFELNRRGLKVEPQKELPLIYQGMKMDAGYRLDLLVDSQVVIEVKAVERFEPIHQAQLLSYLKLSGLHLGFLVNFNTTLIKDGIRRLVHKLPQAT